MTLIQCGSLQLQTSSDLSSHQTINTQIQRINAIR